MDQMNTGANESRSTFKKQSQTPTGNISSKMPQRPGSSKPIQKGNLLTAEEQEKMKRPDSAKNRGKDSQSR